MSQQDDPNDYWPKAYLAIVPRLNASLSILASATIIFLIYRSQAKLSIIYHRIVLCMSIADILASLAMGLTTLPMPKEMPLEVELGYDWPGPRYGNTWTCNAQGFIWVFAGTIGFGLNAMLCLYYACAVAFQMKESNIRKYIQPFIVCFPLSMGLAFPTNAIFRDLINPPTDRLNGIWCQISAYPSNCIDDGSSTSTCIRGRDTDVLAMASSLFDKLSAFGGSIMVVSLLAIIIKFIRTGMLLRNEISNQQKDPISKTQIFSSSHDKIARVRQDTKVIILQSLAYMLAFFGGVMWKWKCDDLFVSMMALFFVPFQGVFNLIIFLSHKVYNYRRTHPEETMYQVIKLLFSSPVAEPCFVSRISVVIQDNFEAEAVEPGIDLEIKFTTLQILDEMDHMEIVKVNRNVAPNRFNFLTTLFKRNAMEPDSDLHAVEGRGGLDFSDEGVRVDERVSTGSVLSSNMSYSEEGKSKTDSSPSIKGTTMFRIEETSNDEENAESLIHGDPSREIGLGDDRDDKFNDDGNEVSIVSMSSRSGLSAFSSLFSFNSSNPSAAAGPASTSHRKEFSQHNE